MISGGRVSSARLADSTEIRSVIVNQDSVTGATLSVSGSNATLNSARDVAVTLPSGQEYRYRYKLDSAGRPTSELETMTFRDDFEDGNSLGWRATGGWSVAGGDLRGVELNNSSIYAQTGLNWADYTLAAAFTYEQLTDKASESRVLFRYQDDNNHYFVETIRRTSDPHQGWHLLLGGRVGGQGFETAWIPLPGFGSEGTPHTLTVEVRGSTFRVSLDGSFRGEFSDGRLSRGSVGYAVQTGVVRYHDLEVTFPGEDLRDPATRDVDAKLRALREAVAQASGPISQIGAVPAAFDPNAVDPVNVQVLEVSSDPDVQAAVTAVVQAASDPSLPVISEYNAKDELLSSVALDGSTTLYEGSQPAARYDRDGNLEITYAYQDGYLSKVTYIQAREKLAEQMEAVRAEIHQREAKGLEMLAEQRQVAFGQLKADAQVVREQLANSLLTLEEETHSLEGVDVSGKAGRRQKSQALNQLRSGVVQIQDAQVKFEQQYAQELGKLDSEVERVRQQISSETAQTFAQIDEQQTELTKELIRQELEPILYQQYRTGMGRDPDEAEIHQVIDALYDQAGNNPEAALDLNTLRAQIQATSDYQTRRDQVARIKQSVRDWMTRYLQASESDKTEMLAALGLTPEEVVLLTGEEINRILNWIDSRSLHFGHSAFLALQEQLVANGIQVDSTTLGLETILIDILVGVLHPKVKNSSELELSLFGLDRVAKLHGLTTSPVQVTLDDLREILASGPAIAHVNGNHYILVQSIADDGTVTYREPNAGPTGQTLTMTQQAFERVWKGVLLSPRAPPHAYQVLTPQEAQSITGSFFPFLIPIFLAILSAITTAITAVITAIGTLLATLGTLLSSVFTAFGTALSGLFQGLGAILSGNLLGGLATIGQGLFTGVTGVFSAVLNFGAGLFGVGSFGELFTLGGLKAFALHTIVPTVLNLSVTRGLEALGVNSTVASLIGAFAGGFVAGGIPSAGASASFTAAAGSTNFLKSAFASAVTSTAIAGTQLGLVKAGLDPTLSSLAGIGVGSITNAMLSGVSVPSAYDPITKQPIPHNIVPWHTATGLEGLGYTLSTNLAPTLAGELAYYGIQRLGESVGLDPRISQLAGITVSHGIRNITNSGNTAQNVIRGMQDGLLRGATSVGLQFATDELDLDPLVGSLATAALSSSIETMLEGRNPLLGVADTYMKSATGLLTLGGPGSTPWERAVYLSKINDFSTIIREQGIGAALETYATSILHRQTIENIWKLGGIYDLLANRDQIEFRTVDGIAVKRIYTDTQKKDYIDLALNDDRLMGKREGNIVMHCDFVKGPDGKMVMRNGEVEILSEDGSRVIQRETVDDFKLKHVTKYDRSGNVIEEIVPVDSKGIFINDQGRVTHGVRKNYVEGVTTTYESGNTSRVELDRAYSPSSTAERQMLIDMGYTEEGIAGLRQIYTYSAEYGKHVLTSKILREDGSVFVPNSPEAKAWLELVQDNTDKVWLYSHRASHDGAPSTSVEIDKAKGVAEIDMELTWPRAPHEEEFIRNNLLTIFDINRYVFNNNVNWMTAVMDAVPELSAVIANRDANFIFAAGVNSDGLTIDQIAQLKSSLQTDKIIFVGHSAGTELGIRSMFSSKADKYILASPRMSPEALYNIMQETGVNPQQVIVVQTWGDFPHWISPIAMPYAGGAPRNWTHIFIENGPGVSLANPLQNHGIPIQGWLSGQKYKIMVNNGPLEEKTIEEVLRQYVND